MTQYPASDKQVAFIEKLKVERGVTALPTEGLTKQSASKMIETLLTMPKVAGVAAAAPKKQAIDEAGMYFIEEAGVLSIYKVQKAVHGSGNLYAKKLILPEEGEDKGEWVYEGRKPLYLDLQKLDLETAKSLGALYGVCVCCGATLTDEKSIEASIGPVCAKKLAA